MGKREKATFCGKSARDRRREPTRAPLASARASVELRVSSERARITSFSLSHAPLLAPSTPLTQGLYHPSMGGYPYAATMGGAPMSPQAMQGMMYGPGGSPSSPGYVDYESIYREMQLRMYAAQQQQQQQQRARAHQGVFRGQGVQPPQPPSRRAASPSTTPPPSPLKPYTNIRRCRWAPTPTKTVATAAVSPARGRRATTTAAATPPIPPSRASRGGDTRADDDSSRVSPRTGSSGRCAVARWSRLCSPRRAARTARAPFLRRNSLLISEERSRARCSSPRRWSAETWTTPRATTRETRVT